MIFRNFAFIALFVASSTLNSAHADRTKLRGRWQVGDAKDAPVNDAAVDIAGTPTGAGLRRRRRVLKKNDDKKDESKKDSKKEDKKGGNNSGNADSTDVGAGNHAAKQQKKNNDEKETAVISNMAGTGNMSPVITSVKPPKDEKDAKKNDKKGGGGDKVKNDAKKKNDKNMETGMYAGTFNYAAVRPQAWNPSAVTLGSAQTSNTNYASPGAATGNMVAGNAVSSAGVYRPPQQQQQPAPVINNNVPAPVYNYAANTNQQQQHAPPVVVSTPPATNVIVQPANTPSSPGVTTGWSGLNRDNGSIAMTGMQCQSSNPDKFRCCNNEGSSACVAAGMGNCCDAFRNMCVNAEGLDATARGNLICKP